VAFHSHACAADPEVKDNATFRCGTEPKCLHAANITSCNPWLHDAILAKLTAGAERAVSGCVGVD